MGYDDFKVINKINDRDRCGLCGLLCDIDFFLETKCYHLFCVDCFKKYLILNNHSNEIRDKENYQKPFNPVRCPISGEVIKFKHTKGGAIYKLKTYLNLSNYKLKCDYHSVGCLYQFKTTKQNQHYFDCYFTSLRNRLSLNNFQVYSPIDDTLINNLTFCELKLKPQINYYRFSEPDLLSNFDKKYLV